MWHAWERNVYKVLMEKPEGKEDGITMDLREIGLGSVDWIQLAQDRDRWLVLAPRT
jgi:hypothetical protein